MLRTSAFGLFARPWLVVQKRFRKKSGVIRKKVTNSDRALAHFDDFYSSVFGRKWHSIRLALLSQKKYCAVVNNYADTDVVVEKLQSMGCVDIGSEFSHFDSLRKDGPAVSTDQVDRISKSVESVFERKAAEELEQIYGTDRPAEDGANLSRVIKPYAGEARSLHSFVPASKLKGMEDWVSESEYFSHYKAETTGGIHIPVEIEDHIHFPMALKAFTFERGNISSFPPPREESTGNLGYYLMDASSLMPVLALDVQLGDTVLDLCASPGGKTFTLLQTFLPGRLIANDVQDSRVNRIYTLLRQYFTGTDVNNVLKVTISNARHMDMLEGDFDRVLVDVPCTTDRHSVTEDDNNIFKLTRIKERLRIPKLQTDLLCSALKRVKPGGTVVYSTCSLSPVQNDGVVYMALKQIWEETKIDFVVKDLSRAVQPLSFLFRLGHRSNMGLRYGQLVLPTVPNNFGPMYFCKIVRTK